jgi:hypothetical protein
MSRRRRDQANVSEIFRLLNVAIQERDESVLRTFPFDPTAPEDHVQYRTILTNGTGRTPGVAHAQLESDSQ